jgi:hypothetical protein
VIRFQRLQRLIERAGQRGNILQFFRG